MANKASLQNILSAVLSVANVEQCQTYPPFVYQNHYNTVTSFLITTLVKIFPSNPMVIDMLAPFIEVVKLPITNGIVTMPDNYRDILGTPMINIKPDASGECGGESDVPVTAQNFLSENLKAGCRRRPIVIVPQSEFAYRTTSTYKFPTYNDPIGVNVGKNKIQVCPYDLAKVEVMYIRNEKTYVYGYIQQPDDTFIFDPNTSTDSEWFGSAFEPIFKGVLSLYSAYTRDKEITDFSRILTQENIL